MIINEDSLKEIISQGEDSVTEFKREIINMKSLAESIVAFLNGEGGRIIFGVDNKKDVVGIDDPPAIESAIINCRDQIRPPPSIFAHNHTINAKPVVYLEIPQGANKPYSTSDGRYFIRHGASKKIMSQEELMRAFQSNQRLHAEETILRDSSFADIDLKRFFTFYKSLKGTEINPNEVEINKTKLKNMKCLENERLTLLGALLLCEFPQKFVPSFNVKGVAFYGLSIGGTRFRSKVDVNGNIEKMFKESRDFVLSNLPRLQQGENFNPPGKIPISEIALEELLVNALIHRDYFRNAPIRLFIFDDRIEIINPGRLPNDLTVENIKLGTASRRNSILCEYARHFLPFAGVGSGIIRALEENPDIQFANNIKTDEFTAIIPLFSEAKTAIEKQMEMNLETRLVFSRLIGNFRDLKSELCAIEQSLEKDFKVVEGSLLELEKARSQNDALKSGAVSKLERLIKNLGTGASKFSEAFSRLEGGKEILSNLRDSFNEIAKRLDLPRI